MKIRIGLSNVNDVIGGILFKDSVSVDDVSAREINKLRGIGYIIMEVEDERDAIIASLKAEIAKLKKKSSIGK